MLSHKFIYTAGGLFGETTRNENPIRVIPKPYRGRDARKLAEYKVECDAASILEDYLNKRRVPGKREIIDYFTIARATGIDEKMVKTLLHRAYGGDNGITIVG